MPDWVAVLISAFGVSVALYFGLKNNRRAEKAEDQREAVDMATVATELKNIGEGVKDIKADLRNVRDDVKSQFERIIRVEESAKQAHKRLDALTGAQRIQDTR
jgi:hypothetical protein